MKTKLKEELKELSNKIISAHGDEELTDLYELAKGLYEKLAVLKFIEEKLQDVIVDVTRNEVATKFEKMANAVLSENTLVPENNPHEEDIITPGMQTIRDMVSEMPLEQLTEQVFSEYAATPEFVKNDKAEIGGETEQITFIKETLGKKLQIGLNDRLAFVKHLFGDSVKEYERVLSQLNTIEEEERAVAFINKLVKPEYNNWEGKEEYVERFMQVISRKFAR